MLALLLLIPSAFPCAMLLTNDEGAIASSDAQEVILEETETGVRTQYRVSYDGDAESFGWLIVVRGLVGDEGVGEASEDLFDELRLATQPRMVSYAVDVSDGGSGGSEETSGCGWRSKSDNAVRGGEGEFEAVDSAIAVDVDVTAEGFAGPYTWRVLDPEDGEALTGWLDEEGFTLGESGPTLEDYVQEGGYSFVAITLTPTIGYTPDEGRVLPPIYIDSDADQMEFPARMSLTGMAEEQRTTVWVLGETTAEISEGWDSEEIEHMSSGSDGDAEGAYDAILREAAARETPTYRIPFSGEHGAQWVTRFDTLAPREVHIADPVFSLRDEAYSWQLEIEVPASDDDARVSSSSVVWLLLPVLGLGWARRQYRA